jgi:hypothetical protein
MQLLDLAAFLLTVHRSAGQKWFCLLCIPPSIDQQTVPIGYDCFSSSSYTNRRHEQYCGPRSGSLDTFRLARKDVACRVAP